MLSFYQAEEWGGELYTDYFSYLYIYGRPAIGSTLLYEPQGGNTCKANEYLAVDSLVPTTRIYLNTVLNILGAS